jgi:hypothetical protein
MPDLLLSAAKIEIKAACLHMSQNMSEKNALRLKEK